MEQGLLRSDDIMRYGVQFQPLSGQIDAGTVRKAGDREVFITKEDVTGQVLGASALWLISQSYGTPYRITDAAGTVYELVAKVVHA